MPRFRDLPLERFARALKAEGTQRNVEGFLSTAEIGAMVQKRQRKPGG